MTTTATPRDTHATRLGPDVTREAVWHVVHELEAAIQAIRGVSEGLTILGCAEVDNRVDSGWYLIILEEVLDRHATRLQSTISDLLRLAPASPTGPATR
jgi:hypothetical protein